MSKKKPRPWEVDCVTPHTSSSFCSSTSTPAYSSSAPSRRAAVSRENHRNQSNSSASRHRDPDNQSTREATLTGESEPRAGSSTQNEELAPSTVQDSASERDRNVESSRHEARPGRRAQTSSTASNSARNYRVRPDSQGENAGQRAATNRPQPTSTGASNTQQAANNIIPDSPTLSGPTHNSLIQIRRGARQDDGSFSFSISVHTSSGRTILFDQHDLESDDEDSDVRIERIIPNLGSNRGQSENTGDEREGLTRRGQTERENTNHEREEPTRNDSNDVSNNTGASSGLASLDDSIGHFGSDDSDVEQESEHDLMEENEYNFDFETERDETRVNTINVEIPGRLRDPSDFSVSIETNSNERDSEGPLFRNPGPGRIRRRVSNTSPRNATNNSSTTSDSASQSNPASGSARSVQQLLDSDRWFPSGGINSRAGNNSYMFVLESNSGNRRRRVLNLSYLDTYTEPESKLLQKNIHSNTNRLLGQMKECNVGKGFIKEVAFSCDGRLISSPYGYGIRLLTFDPQCNELCDCVPSKPVELYESNCSLAHANYVVATQFSPVHNLVVSGCLDGRIVFHQPAL